MLGSSVDRPAFATVIANSRTNVGPIPVTRVTDGGGAVCARAQVDDVKDPADGAGDAKPCDDTVMLGVIVKDPIIGKTEATRIGTLQHAALGGGKSGIIAAREARYKVDSVSEKTGPFGDPNVPGDETKDMAVDAKAEKGITVAESHAEQHIDPTASMLKVDGQARAAVYRKPEAGTVYPSAFAVAIVDDPMHLDPLDPGEILLEPITGKIDDVELSLTDENEFAELIYAFGVDDVTVFTIGLDFFSPGPIIDILEFAASDLFATEADLLSLLASSLSYDVQSHSVTGSDITLFQLTDLDMPVTLTLNVTAVAAAMPAPSGLAIFVSGILLLAVAHRRTGVRRARAARPVRSAGAIRPIAPGFGTTLSGVAIAVLFSAGIARADDPPPPPPPTPYKQVDLNDDFLNPTKPAGADPAEAAYTAYIVEPATKMIHPEDYDFMQDPATKEWTVMLKAGKSYKVEAYIDRATSWVDRNPDGSPKGTADELKMLRDHEQGHLDAAKNEAAKATAEIKTIKGKGKDPQAAFQNWADQAQARTEKALADAKATNETYDSAAESNHGSNKVKQAEWSKKFADAMSGPNLQNDINKKTAPKADSTSSKSIHYDAATRRLTVTEDFIVSIDPQESGFLPSVGDPVIGAEVVFGEFELIGEMPGGGLFFEAVDRSVHNFDIRDGQSSLFSGDLDFLMYADNRLTGIMRDFLGTQGASDLIDELLDVLANDGDTLPYITLDPLSDLSMLTADFTQDGVTAFTNYFGVGHLSLPEPRVALLFAGFAAILVVTRRRRPRTETVRAEPPDLATAPPPEGSPL